MDSSASPSCPLAKYYGNLTEDPVSWAKKAGRRTYSKQEVEKALELIKVSLAGKSVSSIYPLNVLQKLLERMEEYEIDFVDKDELTREEANFLFAMLNH